MARNPLSPIGNPVPPQTEFGGSKAEQGFTLLEVLIALTILSVALTATMGSFSKSLLGSRDTSHILAARSLAQGLLEAAQISDELKFGETTGSAKPDLSWRISVRNYVAPGQGDWPLRPVIVSVSVTWPGARNRDVNLTTLRLLPKANAS